MDRQIQGWVCIQSELVQPVMNKIDVGNLHSQLVWEHLISVLKGNLYILNSEKSLGSPNQVIQFELDNENLTRQLQVSKPNDVLKQTSVFEFWVQTANDVAMLPLVWRFQQSIPKLT